MRLTATAMMIPGLRARTRSLAWASSSRAVIAQSCTPEQSRRAFAAVSPACRLSSVAAALPFLDRTVSVTWAASDDRAA
jgi:hypothetical protein